LFSLFPFKQLKKLELKIDSFASTESHGHYIKNVSFLWPPVVAAPALNSSGCYGRRKVSLYMGFNYVHQSPPFASKCAEDDLRSKSLLL
jgi:hypothetical protein